MRNRGEISPTAYDRWKTTPDDYYEVEIALCHEPDPSHEALGDLEPPKGYFAEADAKADGEAGTKVPVKIDAEKSFQAVLQMIRQGEDWRAIQDEVDTLEVAIGGGAEVDFMAVLRSFVDLKVTRKDP